MLVRVAMVSSTAFSGLSVFSTGFVLVTMRTPSTNATIASTTLRMRDLFCIIVLHFDYTSCWTHKAAIRARNPYRQDEKDHCQRYHPDGCGGIDERREEFIVHPCCPCAGHHQRCQHSPKQLTECNQCFDHMMRKNWFTLCQFAS